MSANTKKITMSDVAEAAGVSKATVSRALAGSNLIGASVRREIEEVALKLGYVRRNVKRHGERCILTVKLVLPPMSNRISGLFFSLTDLVTGLREGLAPAGVNVLVEDGASDYDPYPHKKGGEIEAFVFAFHRPGAAALQAIREHGAATVVLNRTVRGIRQIINHHSQAMDLIAEHLADQKVDGKMCFVSYEGIEDVTKARLKGFKKGCLKHGLPFKNEKDIWVASSPEGLDEAGVRKRYEAGVRTFVGVNDVAGALVLQHVRNAGYRVPDQVRVTGCDHAPICDVTLPRLTTVDLSMKALALEAGRSIYSEVVKNETCGLSLYVPGVFMAGGTT